MLQLSRLFLDNKISRRSFIHRLTQAGVSFAGATAVANVLARDEAASGVGATSEKGRIVENLTGGELMAEFLLDWDVSYVFGLAGSEEVGFLDAFVDRPSLQYATCLHESAAMAMASTPEPQPMSRMQVIGQVLDRRVDELGSEHRGDRQDGNRPP